MLPCRFRYTLLRRVSVRDTMKKRRLKNKVYRLPVTEELKNKKPVDNIEYVKRIKAAINEDLELVKEIKYVKRKFRENVPPLELAWLKIKRGTIRYFQTVAIRFKARFSMAISEFVKQAAKSFTVYAVIFLIIIAIILTVKYLL